MNTAVKTIDAVPDLWTSLVEHAGLDLKHYDAEIEVKIRSYLSLPKKGALRPLLSRNKIEPERLLSGFFAAVQPFTRIYDDILDLIEAIGQKEGKLNLEVAFNFDKARKLKLDLDHFRRQVETFRKVVRPLLTEVWLPDQIWDVLGILQGPHPRLRTEAESYRPPDAVVEWIDTYKSGVWPQEGVELTPMGDSELDSLFARVWSFRMAYLSAIKSSGLLGTNLRDHSGKDTRITVNDGIFEPSPGLEPLLRYFETDHWAQNATYNVVSAAERAIKDADVAAYLKESLSKLFSNIPVHKRLIEDSIRDIEELLRLPIWRHRHELYSIWVLTQIIGALGGPSNFSFEVENETFHIPFAPKRIATLENVIPAVHVWSEVRYMLKNPVGKGRKEGMQPDYTLTTQVADDLTEAFGLIECKQYKREARRSFAEAITDYASVANVFLVNYGPANEEKILEYVPDKLHNRTRIFGFMRPTGKDDKDSKEANVMGFRRAIRKVVEKNCTPITVAEVPSVEESVSEQKLAFSEKEFQARIERSSEHISDSVYVHRFCRLAISLLWKGKPCDLDLYLMVPLGDAWIRVGYANRGTHEAFPWAMFHEDHQLGMGSEFINVTKITTGKYRIFVHAYSEDGSLAGCGATVIVGCRDCEITTFTCPERGEGRWWHVVDYDADMKVVEEIGKIQTADP